MSVYYGTIKNRVIILPEDARLIEGAKVEVRVFDRQRAKARATEDAFQQRLLEIGLMREVGPAAPGQSVQGRALVEVTGTPLSQAIVEDRR
jgi:hypothetical protein